MPSVTLYFWEQMQKGPIWQCGECANDSSRLFLQISRCGEVWTAVKHDERDTSACSGNYETFLIISQPTQNENIPDDKLLYLWNTWHFSQRRSRLQRISNLIINNWNNWSKFKTLKITKNNDRHLFISFMCSTLWLLYFILYFRVYTAVSIYMFGTGN